VSLKVLKGCEKLMESGCSQVAVETLKFDVMNENKQSAYINNRIYLIR